MTLKHFEATYGIGSWNGTLKAHFLHKLGQCRFTLRNSTGASKALKAIVKRKMKRHENIIRLAVQNQKEWATVEAAWMLSKEHTNENASQIIETVFGNRKAKRKGKSK